MFSISSPVEFSEVLTDGVRGAALLRWNVDMGGRPRFISAAITECEEYSWTTSKTPQLNTQGTGGKEVLCCQHPRCEMWISPGDCVVVAGCCSSPAVFGGLWLLPVHLHSPAGSARLLHSRCRANCSPPLKCITICYSLHWDSISSSQCSHEAPLWKQVPSLSSTCWIKSIIFTTSSFKILSTLYQLHQRWTLWINILTWRAFILPESHMTNKGCKCWFIFSQV